MTWTLHRFGPGHSLGRHALLALLAGGLLTGGPADARQPDRKAACSAARLPAALPAQSGLPPAVAKMRQAMVEAARRCDYDALQRLALAGSGSFSYTFGIPSTPAGYWREAEADGQPCMAMLVKILGLPYAKEGESYVWPAISIKEKPTPQDWRSLEGVYTPKEIRTFQEVGAYIGWRLGITATGDWTYFIAGD